MAPGVLGGISLLLALYAFQMLPINYVGLALIILGISFLSVEVFMPSFGIFGIGGTVAFACGSILLIDSSQVGMTIGWQVITLFCLLNLGFFLVGSLILYWIIRAKIYQYGLPMSQKIETKKEETIDFKMNKSLIPLTHMVYFDKIELKNRVGCFDNLQADGCTKYCD